MLLDATPPLVAGWQNVYLITGPSAAALLGLQFVVMALVKESPAPSSPTGVGAFTTPTIIHFAMVLTIAAILRAPWPSLHAAAVALAVCGIFGVLYTLVVWRRIAHMQQYDAVAEDWLWHVCFPLVAYATLATGAIRLPAHIATTLFVIAGTAMFLLFIGIHNAWDIATYLTLQLRAANEQPVDAASATAPTDSVLPQ